MVRKTGIGVSFVVMAIMMFSCAVLLHPFGEPPSVMDDYIIENTQQETGTTNAVSAVVFDYRGFDTLGEATVLFTTVVAVLAIFRGVTQ